MTILQLFMGYYIYAGLFGLSLLAQPSAPEQRAELRETSRQTIQFHSHGWQITDHSLHVTDYTFLESSSSLPKIDNHTLFYKNFYSQIHMKVHVGTSSMKYDFIVNPKGLLSDIRLRISGGALTLADSQRFTIHTPYGTIEESIPFSYQIIKGDTIPRHVTYKLYDAHTVGFTAESYDPNYPLIIDPELVAASLTGSTVDQFANTAAFDTQGNTYVGGEIFGQSTGRYTAIGAYEKAFAGGRKDISITKFNFSGTDVLYFTYLGGLGNETPSSLIVDESSGDLIIYGITSSDDFPVPPLTTSVYDRTYNGNVDIVLARLNSNGTTLISSTYVGGSRNDGELRERGSLTPNYKDELRGEVVIDKDGSIVFVSSTRSNDFPGTSNSFEGGTSDGVIGKMSGNLSSMEWSYYIGGTREDALFSIDTVASGDYAGYYVTGGTTSTDLPIPSTAYQPKKNGASTTVDEDKVDGFVMHIRRDDQMINYGTYLGTDRFDQSYFVEVDKAGSVYVLGQTRSSNYPVQAPAGSSVYRTPHGKVFIHKFDSTLTTSLWSTVVGKITSPASRASIVPTAFLVSECNEIYLAGFGGSRGTSRTDNLPVTTDGYQQTTDGADFYLMVLSQDAAELSYGSYFGGAGSAEHVDGGTSRFDDKGIVYQAVCFCVGTHFPIPSTLPAWSRVNGHPRCNLGFMKFQLASSLAKFSTNNESDTDPGIESGCVPLTMVFKNESPGDISDSEWDFGDGTFTANSNRSVTYTFTQPGTFRIRLRVPDDLSKCELKVSNVAEKIISVYDDRVLISEDQAFCIGEEVQLYASGGVQYKWSPEDFLSDASAARPTVKDLENSITYNVEITTPNGCKKTESVLLSAQPPLNVSLNIQPKDSECAGSKSFFISSQITGGADYITWHMGDGSLFENISGLNYTYKSNGVYAITVEAGNEICYTKITEHVSTSSLFVTNAITPNEDGANDYLLIEGSAKQDADKVNISTELKIFDRNGAVVYHTDNYQNDWNGNNLPAGVYYYAIETSGQDICKGWVHLIK